MIEFSLVGLVRTIIEAPLIFIMHHNNFYYFCTPMQMIALYADHSGEVDLTSGPESEGKSAAVFANLSTQDDINKITELRNTIKSLQTQIEVC